MDEGCIDMDKGQDVNKANIIKFPGLEKKLLEKGLEKLQSRNYNEAVLIFEQCIDLDPSNQDSYIGLLLAYFDSGLIEQAMDLAHHMLREGIGDEIETLNIYLMLLVQRNEHEKVVTEIKQLLKENRIPFHKQEHFEQLLHLSEKMIENKLDGEQIPLDEDSFDDIDLFQYQDPQEQMMIAAELNQRPIGQYEEEITAYLSSTNGDSFFKTLILNVLKEQQYDNPVYIVKFGKQITVIPNEIRHLSENDQLQELLSVIGEELEDEDPILFDIIKSLMERHSFLMYPIPFDHFDVSAWSAAYHIIGNEYNGNNQSMDEMIDLYGANYENVEKSLLFIKKIEEVSYLNLKT